jgi:hypothetical protein
MKALSKSRFKQGLECPNKLYFSNNKEVYHNVKNNDPFGQALEYFLEPKGVKSNYFREDLVESARN